jgi:putative nucleotidyltransferase with HDIG domain
MNNNIKKKADHLKLVSSLEEIKVATPTEKLEGEIIDLKTMQRSLCELSARLLLSSLDQKDHYTFQHSTRVAHYSTLLARELGLGIDDTYEVEMSALFHDIGKIGVPDHILLKPERLDEDEFLIMKKHPEKSAEILQGLPMFTNIALNVRHHHERFDGRGYPDGLKGEQIPLAARIILITDTFDAITSSRTYRKAMNYDIAYEELNLNSGTQFDPNLVQHFIRAIEKQRHAGSDTDDFSLNLLPGNVFAKKAA